MEVHKESMVRRLTLVLLALAAPISAAAQQKTTRKMKPASLVVRSDSDQARSYVFTV